ncbi:MAG TPA: formate--tetrahydrofolate ligase [Bacilli bacterium]|nr:formate--tetrahydrofolate ligase [Bacilli bacterium]
MLTDIEISRLAKKEKITSIAEKLNLKETDLEIYGSDKAKVKLSVLEERKNGPDGKLILVTAITPTPAGEGKSTTTIGLVDALNRIGKKAVVALREPSLGPVMGIKGGAAGGGYAQVNPMEDLNLHFTGDIHAVSTANNLISAIIDNHIYQGNELNIHPKRIVWKRAMDMNDRSLRKIMVGMGSTGDGVIRDDGFNITVASEIMAVLCLATSLEDLREKVSRIIVAYTYDNKPVTIKDLGIVGAVLVVLKDAIKPNIIQTLENNPAFVHGGPFANIAHGCNSILATTMALKLADYVVTEAGFGADLGAEKFLDIKCREANLRPSCVVIVATVRALKYHGGKKLEEISQGDVEALRKGVANLDRHTKTIRGFNLNYVVAINRFHTDTDEEISFLQEWAKANNHPIALSEVFAKGGAGGEELARKVVEQISEKTHTPMYEMSDKIEDKIAKIANKVYGAKEIIYSEDAKKTIQQAKKLGFSDFYICMAKTPLSITDNPKISGAPQDFTINIKEVRISAGAKFLVCLTGDVMTMPGLPKVPAANALDIDSNYNIHNLS